MNTLQMILTLGVWYCRTKGWQLTLQVGGLLAGQGTVHRRFILVTVPAGQNKSPCEGDHSVAVLTEISQFISTCNFDSECCKEDLMTV